MARLDGKVAIVTGAALGIGRAIVLRMAQEGAAVAVLDVLDGPGQALADEVTAGGRQARYWRCDVASEAEVARVTAEAVAHFGRLDILVNNAGIAGVNKPTHELTEAEWD